jgi:hypothetical protein
MASRYIYILNISDLRRQRQLTTWLSEWTPPPTVSQEATALCPTGTVPNIDYSLLSLWYATVTALP